MASRTPLVLRAGDVAAAVEGRLVRGEPATVVGRISIDSRTLSGGETFVAIRGERVDGHAFVAEAIRRGAHGVMVSDPASVEAAEAAGATPGLLVIVVEDTTQALQRVGRWVRRLSGARVVAITGSVGKTTTKEMTAAGLAARYDVSRTVGNLNNHIGVPLSLLELRRCPDVAVLELGMNHAGEIRTLVGLAEPEYRVWTNVAEVHAEFFDSIDAIADAKAEILDGATADTRLVANADDQRVMSRVGSFPGRVTTFGLGPGADVRATDVASLGLLGMEATVRAGDETARLKTALLGEAAVANALAAVAVALEFGIPLEEVVSQLSSVEPERHRGEIIRLGGVVVVDDSYNSNPLALERVLETVGRLTGASRRIAVVGEMLELGRQSAALHRRCGQVVAREGFDQLLAVGGRDANALAEGAVSGGMDPRVVRTVPTSKDAADVLVGLVNDGDVVLVKGSRGVRMERVVERLAGERG